MPTATLAGQVCVHCSAPIAGVADGRVCPGCRCPVHTACSAARPAADGACPGCHAPAAAVEDARKAAVAAPAAKPRRPGLQIVAAGAVVLVVGAVSVIQNLGGDAADLAAGGLAVLVGAAGVALGVVRLARAGQAPGR